MVDKVFQNLGLVLAVCLSVFSGRVVGGNWRKSMKGKKTTEKYEGKVIEFHVSGEISLTAYWSGAILLYW